MKGHSSSKLDSCTDVIGYENVDRIGLSLFVSNVERIGLILCVSNVERIGPSLECCNNWPQSRMLKQLASVLNV